jgi:hypothetical protein
VESEGRQARGNLMIPSHLKLIDPAVMCNVQRKRKPYDGQRQDLTRDEIEKLFAALKRTRNGHRDYMIGVSFASCMGFG